MSAVFIGVCVCVCVVKNVVYKLLHKMYESHFKLVKIYILLSKECHCITDFVTK